MQGRPFWSTAETGPDGVAGGDAGEADGDDGEDGGAAASRAGGGGRRRRQRRRTLDANEVGEARGKKEAKKDQYALHTRHHSHVFFPIRDLP